MYGQTSVLPNSFNELLDHLGINDPRIRSLSDFLESRRLTRETSSAECKLAKKQEALDKIEKIIQEKNELGEENNFLRQRLDILAAAVGACPYCWGEDAMCSCCCGQGGPGYLLPDRDAFNGYIMPAVRSIRKLSHRTVSPPQKEKE